ncbi:protein kinase domain-containing protein [Streptomyces sp. 4N509B]|uniref:protein kinase domain-containing protein n=1 Tax=Streptomyces sp. 4N509B TaxID=3457413 RepID=UPI003FD3F934
MGGGMGQDSSQDRGDEGAGVGDTDGGGRGREADAPRDGGTLHMGPRDEDASEPGTLVLEGLGRGQDASEPRTLAMGAVEPRDDRGANPATLNMGQVEAGGGPASEPVREPLPDEDEPGEDEPGGDEPTDAVPTDAASRDGEEPRDRDTPRVPPEPGTVHLTLSEPEPEPEPEPEDATPPPTPSTRPWTGGPGSDDDDSLGGDAPLVGLPGDTAADPRDPRARDDEDHSLGGDAPLVSLPTEPTDPPTPATPAPPEEVAAEEPAETSVPRIDPLGWSPDHAGRLLASRYRLVDAVGRGGMGTVWRAEDEILGRAVAVKELRLPASVDDSERGRLITRTLREAKAIASIRSNGVVTIFDVVDEGSRPWIVMELIEGRSLADVIRHEGPMPPVRVAEIGLAVLDVLRAAHGAGILHRDVKPSNVLVAHEDGRVVLTDFGIAKVEGDPSITSTGMLVGAPSYISPERARGEVLGPATDLWSLGALLYCCVEGRPPYDEGSAIATLSAVMHEPVPPPRQAGPLTEVLTGLLDKEPALRLTEAAARELLLGVVADARRPPMPEPSVGGAAGGAADGAADEPEGQGESAPEGETSGEAGDGGPGTVVLDPRRTTPGGFGEPATPPMFPAPEMPPPPSGPSPLDGGTPPPPSAPDGGKRSRTILLAAVAVVVLAGLAVALVLLLGGDDSPAEGERDDPGASADESPQGEDSGGASGDPATDEPTDGATDEPTDGATDDPTDGATEDPTDGSTDDPTGPPTNEPTEDPTTDPTDDGPPGTTPSNDPDPTIPTDPTGA